MPESGAGRLAAVVALGPHEPGDARTAALAALEAVNLVKLVTVVDDDVDPWDDAAVAHAVATRVHLRPRSARAAGHARRSRRAARARREIAKLAIDATRRRRRSRRLDARRAAAVTLEPAPSSTTSSRAGSCRARSS